MITGINHSNHHRPFYLHFLILFLCFTPQANKYLHTSFINDNNSKNFISSKTHRSQLLYRLVQCLLRHAYDNGIIVRSYLPITLAENRTYSGTLQTDNQVRILQLGNICNKKCHNYKALRICSRRRKISKYFGS